MVRLESMAGSVPLDAPYEADNAVEWDGQTFETWKRENLQSEGARAVVDLATQSVLGAQPRELSLLFALFFVHSAGGGGASGNFQRLISVHGGAQERRFAGGSQLVPLRQAEALRGRIRLGSRVVRIAHDGGRVVATTADGTSVAAAHAIVAVPPTLAGRIAYEPGLPAARDLLTQRIGQGSTIKVQAVYDRPFWRDQGMTGQVISGETPLTATFDNSPPDGGPGVLMGFVVGDNARAYAVSDPARRQAQVLEQLAGWFGPRAASPSRFVEALWCEDVFTRGCPVGIPAVGALTSFGPALRAPVGRIHWAGTETASKWVGYMDGAISSGLRAASEVLGG
jgi:monoamine oxidase